MDRKSKILKFVRYYGRIFRTAAIVLGPVLLLALALELIQGTKLLSGRMLLHLLRDMIPALIVIGGALVLAASFIAAVHDARNWRQGLGVLWRGMFGQPRFSPIVIVAKGKIREKGTSEALLRVGGSGSILVYNDSAVVLEQGGRVTRVVEPGSVDSLGQFERIREIVDLRPIRWNYKVEAMSKEGIPVTVPADIVFQVNTGAQDPSEKTPYPAMKEAIFRASTCRWMRDRSGGEDDQYFDWVRRIIISNTEGGLRGIIATYKLNQLIGLEEKPDEKGKSPRKEIKRKLKEKLEESAADLGVKINEVDLGTIEVTDEVTRKLIETWWSKWKGWALAQEKQGEVERDKLREQASIQAQADIIIAVAQGFQQLVKDSVQIPSQLLYMRVIEVLRQSALDPTTRCFMSNDAIKMLKNLRNIGEEQGELGQGQT
jgi:regulator of protease activity HflC (stomatin/prohibitin superfamily)